MEIDVELNITAPESIKNAIRSYLSIKFILVDFSRSEKFGIRLPEGSKNYATVDDAINYFMEELELPDLKRVDAKKVLRLGVYFDTDSMGLISFELSRSTLDKLVCFGLAIDINFYPCD